MCPIQVWLCCIWNNIQLYWMIYLYYLSYPMLSPVCVSLRGDVEINVYILIFSLYIFVNIK